MAGLSFKILLVTTTAAAATATQVHHRLSQAGSRGQAFADRLSRTSSRGFSGPPDFSGNAWAQIALLVDCLAVCFAILADWARPRTFCGCPCGLLADRLSQAGSLRLELHVALASGLSQTFFPEMPCRQNAPVANWIADRFVRIADWAWTRPCQDCRKPDPKGVRTGSRGRTLPAMGSICRKPFVNTIRCVVDWCQHKAHRVLSRLCFSQLAPRVAGPPLCSV